MTKRLILALAAALLVEAGVCTVAARAQETIAPPISSPITTAAPMLDNVFEGETIGPARANRQFWVTSDFILGFTRGANFPTLATTADPGTPQKIAGIPGAPGTSTLFTGWQNDDLRAGFRFGAGWWFNHDPIFGIEAGGMFLNGQTTSLFVTSATTPIIGRPYIDANGAIPQAVLVAFPGQSTGTLDIQARAGNFASAHFDFAEKAFEEGWFRITALAGYRYYRYDESLNIRQTLNPTDPNFIPGTQAVTNDSFSTRNEFHGFDMGVRNQYFWDRFSVEFLAKVAVGDVRRQVNISGDQTVSVPGQAPVLQQGGVLALTSNSGTFISHDWKILPEFGTTLQWQLLPNLNVRLGYSFLLLNGIVRTADQVDRTLNPNLFPPPLSVPDNLRRPLFGWTRSDMWIQTVNIGVAWNF